MDNILGRNIKLIRERWGLSQEQFGKLINATRGMVMQYEKRGSTPKSDVMDRLLEVTGKTREELSNSIIKRKDLPILLLNDTVFELIEEYSKPALKNKFGRVKVKDVFSENQGQNLYISLKRVVPYEVYKKFHIALRLINEKSFDIAMRLGYGTSEFKKLTEYGILSWEVIDIMCAEYNLNFNWFAINEGNPVLSITSVVDIFFETLNKTHVDELDDAEFTNLLRKLELVNRLNSAFELEKIGLSPHQLQLRFMTEDIRSGNSEFSDFYANLLHFETVYCSMKDLMKFVNEIDSSPIGVYSSYDEYAKAKFEKINKFIGLRDELVKFNDAFDRLEKKFDEVYLNKKVRS